MILKVAIKDRTDEFVFIAITIIHNGSIFDIFFEFYYNIDTIENIYKEFINETNIYIDEKSFKQYIKPLIKNNGRIISISLN
jgi:hypothetical protein